MLQLTILTISCILVSLFVNRKKTWQGIRQGLVMFWRLMPMLLLMLSLVGILLFVLPDETLARYMGENSGTFGWLIAAFLGSISLIPGFIAFPLSNVLIKSGVAYSTIAVFITTLMMVGIITLPLESRYFGLKTSIVRNLMSLAAALLTGLLMSFLL